MRTSLEMNPTSTMQSPCIFLLFMRHVWHIQQNWVGSIRKELSSLDKVMEKRSL